LFCVFVTINSQNSLDTLLIEAMWSVSLNMA